MDRRVVIKGAMALAVVPFLPLVKAAESTILVFDTFYLDIDLRTITVFKPTPFLDVYKKVKRCDSMMFYSMPFIGATTEYFEFQNGWGFDNDKSRNMVRNVSWREEDYVWEANEYGLVLVDLKGWS